MFKNVLVTFVLVGTFFCLLIPRFAWADKVRVLIVAETDDFAAGQAIRIGRDRTVSTFEGIAAKLRSTGVDAKVQVLDGGSFERSKFDATFSSILSVITENDTFIFYYIGHGRNVTGKDFPLLLISGQKSEGILLDDIADRVDAIHPRLSILIAEACNGFSDDGGVSPGVVQNTPAILKDTNLDKVIVQLFSLNKGSIVMASASAGQYAGASPIYGPFFTSRLLNILRDYVFQSAQNHNFAEWQPILEMAKKKIQFGNWSQEPEYWAENLGTLRSQAPPPPTSDRPPSVAFMQGAIDRREWENWFASLSGDYRAGAAFWAQQRSTENTDSCYGPNAQSLGDWTAGCLAAKRRLERSDSRRRGEPEYKQGWNSI
jgi:hypothetical protein